MAKPNLKFKTDADPYELRCGERRILDMQVKPRAVGKCTLKLYLVAKGCAFENGSKEMLAEFDCADVKEKRDVEIKLVLSGKKPEIYSLNLNAEVTNADDGKNDDFLLVKLDCRNPMSEAEQTIDFDEEPLTDLEAPLPKKEDAVVEEDDMEPEDTEPDDTEVENEPIAEDDTPESIEEEEI